MTEETKPIVADSTTGDQAATISEDWRVRLALAEGAKYLYKAPTPGILAPLAATNGVVFPYTPTVNISYMANYDGVLPTHSNYKIQQYMNSAVESITVTGDFTAQDTFEANYLLSCIHFFKSMTKMFYGQDEDPTNGTPPPLGYFFGLGAFQLDNCPVAISSFTYNLPNNVDYIRATNSDEDTGKFTQANLIGGTLLPGGQRPPATFVDTGVQAITYVPTKITLTLTCIPVISRNQISNTFSLKDYATGKLLRGSQGTGPGIW
jgi:hypothetical protein|tara:strand:- start:351 stop:1139 length:789 start_codon:yes stop_codon:yes gene_type:complete